MITLADCTVEIIAEQDDIGVRGNAMCSDDPTFDKECEDEILRRLDQGDTWAWASVTVRVSYAGFVGEDYLGCCCYEDEADFVSNGAYYADMKATAFDDMVRKMRTTYETLAGVFAEEGVSK